MPAPRLIPCLDVAGGRVVKGVRFESLRDMGDPASLARHYSDQGADDLVLLDIRATIDERAALVDTVRAVADAISIPFTVGGGIASVDDALRLIDAGADRVALNSAAIADPTIIEAIARRLGAQAVVLSVDHRHGRVVARAGTSPTRLDAVLWAREAVDRGAGEILLTSIEADGTGDGYDLDTTRAVRDAVAVPVIASGGAGTVDDIARALRVADGALVATLLHTAPTALADVRAQLIARGIALREVPEAKDGAA